MRLPFELLAPWGLGLAGLLAPLVVLYILKVQRQRLRVASTWLWREAKRDLMARSPFKRLVMQLPLILQALALVALALAAARPATVGKPVDGDHIAIVIDTSASMATVQDAAGTTRIELGRRAAHEIVRGLAPGSDAMILDAGRDARISLPPDRDTRRMHQAIDKIVAHEVEGDLGAAVTLAVGRLKQQGGKRKLYLITDGKLARPAPLRNPAVPTELVVVGALVGNAAIVRVDVRAGIDPVLAREQVQAFLLVANYGERARELFVTMKQLNASDTLASRKVLVEPGQKLPVVLTFNPADGDYGSGLIFDISPHDALAVDDVAFGRVPAGRKLPVVLASTGTPSVWLERALVADPDAEVRAAPLGAVVSGKDIPIDAFVVVDGACPPAVAGGDLLVVNPPGGSCHGTLVGASVDKPLVTSWEQSDIRLRFLTLDRVFIARARLLEPDSKRQELIRSDQGVIATDISTSARYGTLVGFDVAESDWPYQASFVVFVRNLLEQARAHRGNGISGPATAGEPLRASVPVGVERVMLEGPAGEKASAPVRNGLAVVPNVQRVGLYRLGWDAPSPGSVLVPVNLTSADESDLGRALPETAGAVEVSEASAPVESHREHAWLLALLALAFVLLDVAYLTRRPRAVALPATAAPLTPERAAAARQETGT